MFLQIVICFIESALKTARAQWLFLFSVSSSLVSLNEWAAVQILFYFFETSGLHLILTNRD